MYIERKSNKIKTLFFIEQKSKINPKRKFKQKERSSPNKKVSERAKQNSEGDKKKLQNKGNLVTGFKQTHQHDKKQTNTKTHTDYQLLVCTHTV